MRLILSLGAVSLALAGCVAPVSAPQQPSAPIVNPTVRPAQPSGDALNSSTRAVARDVVNREMAKRLPGRNVGPYTDCVVNNASMAELSDIAARGVSDSGAAASSVAVIVQRPAATDCIARVAQTA
ncbi:hypothetical protein SAMN05421538_10434 [Paracoccus isoporae]|uniref:Uncharacterized protein n=1 Tax=Paracoccus isoporae TaxID=591205 RepID=A0A1G7A598_9RHOB|nr:hypothetical protein [Paracoccus isoporae]SDE10019.1 hypothetical protein SAMN05421538_10434 [Paracoccus isoporae]